MPEVTVVNMDNKETGKVDLPKKLFDGPVRIDLIHEAVKNYLANQRQGNASTKTKGLVRGGGKKPWRQKGTGRARAGSIRSPLWRGGGTVFGPLPRDYSYKLPKKVKRKALYAAFTSKLQNESIIVINEVVINEPKTRLVKKFLETMQLDNKRVLLVVDKRDRNLELASRNLYLVKVAKASDLNVYDLLYYEKMILTMKAVNLLKELHANAE
jgi:large subunit ribosomal protein L4